MKAIRIHGSRSMAKPARASLQNRQLVIDLKGLTAISQGGENVLLALMNERVKFRSGCLPNTC
jgi:hypothetical protein